MSYDTEFQDNPVAFLGMYAILPTPGRINGVDGRKVSTARFSFKELDFESGGLARKTLTLDQEDTGFEAYWLSYEDNKSKRAILGVSARFMFTANMDGCSFGFGSKTETGEILVGHANASDIGTEAESGGQPIYKARQAQAKAQYQMLRKKMEPGSLKVLHPSDYADPFHGSDPDEETNIYKYAATVVGIRDGGWKFYCQRRVITTSGQFILKDVLPLN